MSQAAYIEHHLKHWSYQAFGSGSFGVLHMDTLLISLFLGVGFVLTLHILASRFQVESPGLVQVTCEMLSTFVNDLVEESMGKEHARTVGAFALTVVVWVFLMNCMDLIPVDFFPVVASYFGVEYFRPVPTADSNMTFALSVGVMGVVYYYGIAVSGFLKWGYHMLADPFGIYLFPVNIAKHLVSDLSKILSLSLRLFGNLFSGELVFILIATTPWIFQWIPYSVWLLFHLFVVSLQAFIFMVLTIIYIGMAKHD